MVALGLAACVAVVVFNTSMKPVELGAKSQHAHKVHKAMQKGLGLKHSDMSLLESAMADQSKEKHAACLMECTSKDCKKACGALAPGAKAKAAKTMAEERKKGLGLKKGDLSLLKDAQKARHAEELKHCQACVSAECKANCKATIAAAKKSAKVQLSQKKVKGLGLKTSDLKLLQDAEKRQNREEKMIKAMHAHDAKFLHKGGKSNAVDDVNHVVRLAIWRRQRRWRARFRVMACLPACVEGIAGKGVSDEWSWMAPDKGCRHARAASVSEPIQ